MSEPVICIANIGRSERRKRLVNGVIALSGGIILLAILLNFGRARGWRLLLFPAFGVAASGFLQWQAQTCVRLAAQGVRQLSEEVEPIYDTNELAQVRLQARQVRVKTVAAAGLLTLLTLMISES